MKLLSAIVLVLWTACFLHCSAEQYGLLVCDSCSPECCESEECGEADCDGGGNGPCGVCEFLSLGGVPIGSALNLDAAPESDNEPETDVFLALLERHAQAGFARAKEECHAVEPRPYVHLYEFLARRTIPARGPNA